MRQGICSTCQSRHPVRYDPKVDRYYLFDHDAFGKSCAGGGQEPEAVIGDSEAQRDADEWDYHATSFDAEAYGEWDDYMSTSVDVP